MRYDIEKLIDILVIFAKNSQELTKLRINKLLYFLDKIHIQKYGRLVLNDRYYRLEFGPIPSVSYNIINDFFMPEIKISGKKIINNRLKKYFIADKNQNGYDLLNLKQEVNFNSLSESELEVLDEVLTNYGKKSTGDLVNLSHKDKTWTETEEPDEIDYSLFLEGLTGKRKKAMLQLMEIDKEYDLIAKALNR